MNIYSLYSRIETTVQEISLPWLVMLFFAIQLTIFSLAQKAAAEPFVGPLPKSVVLKTLVRYDPSILEGRLGGAHANFTPYIDKVVLRTKEIMLKLDIPVNLEIIGIEYFPQNITSLSVIDKHNVESRETRFVSYFSDTYSKAHGVGGVAKGYGVACKTDGRAYVVLSGHVLSMIPYYMTTWAHELGHTLGFQ